MFLDKAVTAIFVLNFSTAGPNVTILTVILLGGQLPFGLGLAKAYPFTKQSLRILIGGVLFSNLLILLPLPAVPLIAAILGLSLTNVLLLYLMNTHFDAFMQGIISGTFYSVVLRTVNNTAPLYATPRGTILWIIVQVFFLIVLMQYFSMKFDHSEVTRSYLGVSSYLFLMYVYLGSPAVLSSWFGLNYSLTTILLLVALLLSQFLVVKDFNTIPYIHLVKHLLFLGGITVLLFVDYVWVIGIVLLPTVVSSIFLLKDTITPITLTISTQGRRTYGYQMLLVVLMLLQALSGNWAFLPGFLEGILRGWAAWYILFIAFSLSAIHLVKSTGGIK